MAGTRKRRSLPRLGAAEIELLEMLWRNGPVALSEAHEAFGQPIGYTTVQTRLNRLVAKGLAAKTNDRPAKYQAAVTREEVSRHDLNVLVDRVHSGSFAPLVAHLLQERDVSADDIAQLKKLIAAAEKKLKG